MSAMDALCLDGDDDDDDGVEKEEDGNVKAAQTKRKKRDKSLLKMKIVGVRPGEEIDLSKQIKGRDGKKILLRTFPVTHGSVPALGYLLTTRLPPALKPQYRELPGQKIGELVRSGVQVKEDKGKVEVEVAYTGDTSVDGLLTLSTSGEPGEGEEEEAEDEVGGGSEKAKGRRHRAGRRYLLQALREAHLLLCETTFLGDDGGGDAAGLRELAADRGHMHALDLVEALCGHGWWNESDDDIVNDDVVTLVSGTDVTSQTATEEGEGNQVQGPEGHQKRRRRRKLVLFHVSARHRPASRALDMLAEALPPILALRTDVAVASLLSDEERGGGEREGCLQDLVREDMCINLGEYVRWRDGRRSAEETT